MQWKEGLHFDNIIEYNHDGRNPEKALVAAIQVYPSCWIVLEYRTGYLWTRPILFDDFTHKGKAVHFLITLDCFQIRREDWYRSRI